MSGSTSGSGSGIEPPTTNYSNSSCLNGTTNVKLSVISASVGLLSMLACVGVIILIILMKKYMFFIQRLIFYLSIAALSNCIVMALRFIRLADHDGKFEDPVLHHVCIIAGFLDETTAWYVTLAFVCITITLFRSAVFHKDSEKFEILYILIIFVSPLFVTWIPFIHNTYGEAGPWCWIRKHDDNCAHDKFGVVLRYALWYVPNYVILGIVFLAYVFIIINVLRKKHKWFGRYDPETKHRKEMMTKEVWPLLLYPLGYILISLFPLMNRLHDTFSDGELEALWILHAIFEPFGGAYIALIYTFDRETLRRLNLSRMIASICSKTKIKEYPVKKGYTDSFSEPHEPRIYGFKDEGEALLKKKDYSTEYGSTEADSKT